MEEYIEWMTLSQLDGVGPNGFRQFVDCFGSPAEVLNASQKELEMVSGVRKNQLRGFGAVGTVRQACRVQLERLHKLGGDCLLYDDSDYPQTLKEIKDPPPVLYMLGDKKLLNGCCVGAVGSRSATAYGRRIAFTISKKLAEKGVTVVSGLALGIDAESHRGALAADGKTIAVLGCGIDVVYPPQNRKLFDDIAKKGVILSEYPLATAPEGFRFPARNRIIAGLSKGVLVVEAARKSGSLITAQLALDEGRDVFAVPGQVDSIKSEGAHWLLQQGAKLVQSEMDILEELPSFSQSDHADTCDSGVPVNLETDALQLLQCIETYPCSRDELIDRSGMAIPQLSELLLILELEGLIEMLPGDEICRIVPAR